MAREIPDIAEGLIRGVMTSGGHESHFNHWSYGVMSSLITAAPEIAWPILLEAIDRAPDEMLAYIAAGPLEDLISEHGFQIIDALEREARRSPKLRKTLVGVWRHLTVESIWNRVQALIDDDARTAWEAFPFDVHRRKAEWNVEGRPPTVPGSFEPEQVARRTHLLTAMRHELTDDFMPFSTPVYVHVRVESGPDGDLSASAGDVAGAVAEALSINRRSDLVSAEHAGFGAYFDRGLVREISVFDVFSREPSFTVAVSRMQEEQVASISDPATFDEKFGPEPLDDLRKQFAQDFALSGLEVPAHLREALRNLGFDLPEPGAGHATVLPPIPISELPSRPRLIYLEFVGGASSKFYAVTLEDNGDDRWSVRFNFGRIGFPRAWAFRVEHATWPKAFAAWTALAEEKQGKGYEVRPWPAYLKLPDGAVLGDEDVVGDDGSDATLFRASTKGSLPPEAGGTVAGIQLPAGSLSTTQPGGGSRGGASVLWASNAPVEAVDGVWVQIASAFKETGVWPLIIDTAYGFGGFGDRLFDTSRGRHKEVLSILRKGWNDNMGFDEDEPPLEEIQPFGRQFPGLAAPTPGPRATSIDEIVAGLEGHLGLVAVHRPADVLDAIGWQGAANYDADPLDMSTVLRSWETRFDAYLVGLTTDTLTVAVGRPPRDLDSALAIAAEHFAFCPDNITQGAGSLRAYAEQLVKSNGWMFWWD